jgi:hypothetical protein
MRQMSITKASGGTEHGLFYYIKDGAQSDPYWDYKGNARSVSFDRQDSITL